MNNERIIFPSYYKSFKCKAGLCSESCCLGWEIDIDGETLERYKSLQGELGEKIRKNTATRGDVSHFVMKNRRCPLLNEENLCEIILSLGEGALCEICREHPRYYNTLSGVTLGGVGMSCEAAAELIVGQENPSLYGDITPLLDKDSEDFEASALICSALLSAEEILFSDELSETARLEAMLEQIKLAEDGIFRLYFGLDDSENGDDVKAKPCASNMESGVDAFGITEIFEGEGSFEPSAISALKELIPSLEFMSEKLPEGIMRADLRLARERWQGSGEYRRAMLNIAGYLAARYLPMADGEFSPSSFIFASLLMLFLLFSECDATAFEVISDGENGKAQFKSDEAIRAAVLFSSEIEYSEENVEKLNIS